MNGWIPDQHGAWPMALMPLTAGLIITTPKTPALTFLTLAWVSGFLLFSVSEKYIKSRFRPRYRPATITYAILAAAFTALTLLTAPNLFWWALLYVPLIGYWAFSVWRRKERDLAPRFSTIIAAALVIPVAVNTSSGAPWFAHFEKRAWLMAGLLGAYFALTVPYVKTLIRERNNPTWLHGSIVGHVIATVIVWVFFALNLVPIWHALAWVLVCARAVMMPLIATHRGKPWRPAVVGTVETVLSLLVFAALPWAV